MAPDAPTVDPIYISCVAENGSSATSTVTMPAPTPVTK